MTKMLTLSSNISPPHLLWSLTSFNYSKYSNVGNLAHASLWIPGESRRAEYPQVYLVFWTLVFVVIATAACPSTYAEKSLIGFDWPGRIKIACCVEARVVTTTKPIQDAWLKRHITLWRDRTRPSKEERLQTQSSAASIHPAGVSAAQRANAFLYRG